MESRVIHERDAPGALGRAFAAAGGLLFAGSIAFFLVFYLFLLEDRAQPALSPAAAGVLNTLLFAAFAFHHSAFARTRLRLWIARAVSPHLERAVYVWIASVVFLAVCAIWLPMGPPLWDTDGVARTALRSLQLSGVAFTLWAARALDGLSLAGIRQLDAPLPPSGVEHATVALQDTGPYGIVRHPIYLGWILIVWPAPAMTPAHLLFAAVSTAYLVVATYLEEASLHETFGPAYAEYAKRVRWKMLPGIH